MRKSSIHIKQVDLLPAARHNCREVVPEYVIDTAQKNECNRNTEEVFHYFNTLLGEAHANYRARTKQKIQTKKEKYIWEAVVNLTEEHSFHDVIELSKKLEKKYGWQVLQCSLHADEGYVDPLTDEKKYNYHAHLLFFMLSPRGIYMFKKRDFGKKQMSELQTFVAITLKMQRGKSKLKTQKVRLSHHQYRMVRQEIEEYERLIRGADVYHADLMKVLIEEKEKNRVLQKELEMLKKQVENHKSHEISDLSNDEKLGLTTIMPIL